MTDTLDVGAASVRSASWSNVAMAFVSRMLTDVVSPQASVRGTLMFLSPSRIDDCITCYGRIVERNEYAKEMRPRIALGASTPNRRELAQSEATIVLPYRVGKASPAAAKQEGEDT